MSKPMKPARAWAVVDQRGVHLRSMYGVPMLRKSKRESRLYEQWSEDGKRQYLRALRVRILDDVAVERAIAVLRLAGENLGHVLTLEIPAAIRDLGGKP